MARAEARGGHRRREAPAGEWPQIFITKGELPRVVDEAEEALLGSGREVYQRGGLLVRPLLLPTIPANDDWKFTPLTRPWLVEALTCAARFLKYDARGQGLRAGRRARRGRRRAAVARRQMEAAGARRHHQDAIPAPRRHRCAKRRATTRRAACCTSPAATASRRSRSSPAKPTRLEALALLDRLLDGFPFVSRADRAVALSAILTMLDRRSMTAAPLHAFTSPAAGTGKSLLVDVVALLATRRPMPVISQGARGNEEELEKRLGAALLAGDAAISLDNCEHPLQGSFLCQALTQQSLNIRLLGVSKNVETPVNAAIYATGNNLTVVGDLTRRTLICGLDAQCERPELRTFADDIVDTVLRERGRLVAAALTVLRAWHVSGERVGVVPFGSFESWSYRVREPLVWLGCADPCETVAKVREDDPRRTALLTVLVQWKDALGTGSAHTMREIIAAAVNRSDFHNALLTVAAARSGNVVSNERLGRWFKSNEGKIVNRLNIIRDGIENGYPMWQAE